MTTPNDDEPAVEETPAPHAPPAVEDAAPKTRTRDGAGPRLDYRAAAVQLVPGSVNMADRTVDCVFSTGAAVERTSWSDGDYVEVLLIDNKSVRLDRMNAGAPMLDSHNYWGGLQAMIGAVVPGSARIDGGNVVGKVKFSRSIEGDRAFQDMCDGILTGLSVGYVTHKVEIDDTRSPTLHTVTDWEPYEVSGCPMPADVGAGFRSAQPHGSPRGSSPANPQEDNMTTKTDAPAGAPSAELDANTRSAINTAIQTGIKAEQDRRDGIADIGRKLGLSDELVAEHVRKETSLDSFRGLAIDEASKMERAAPQTDASNPFASNPHIIRGGLGRDLLPGEMAARMLRCVAFGKRSGVSPLEIAGRMWGDVKLQRALAAGIGAAGGYTVQEMYYDELIEFLRPASVVRKMDPTIIPMPGGNMSVPRLANGANGGYIGENQPLIAQQEAFGMVKLSARKAGALVPISNDLLRFSSPKADEVVRQDLIAALATTEDVAFIRGAGTQFTPKGMRNWAPVSTNVIAANGTINQANTIQDANKLVNALTNANCRMLKPGWLMAWRTRNYLYNLISAQGNFVYRDEMNMGKWNGYPFGVSNNIPINLGSGSDSEIYLVDFADAVIGEVPGLIFNTSTEAAYNVDATTLVSAFSNDQTVIQVIEEHDFAMRHDASVAVLTGVQWI